MTTDNPLYKVLAFIIGMIIGAVICTVIEGDDGKLERLEPLRTAVEKQPLPRVITVRVAIPPTIPPTTTSPPTTTTTVAPTTTSTTTVQPTTTHTHRPTTTRAPTPTASGSVWDRLRLCEAPDWSGGWQANTGNGYYGGLQFSLSSWRLVGGTGYPHQHSREVQIEMGKRLLARQGWGAWPTCSRKLGLR